MDIAFIPTVRKQFEYYKSLADKTFSQVSDEGLNWRYNDESNSIAMLVHHLQGNMLSRWTDFLTSDGEKEWRTRDAEFSEAPVSREEMMSRWESGWKCLFDALDGLTEADLGATVYIRNQGHTVVDAIVRQMAHYPYHIGQIVALGKMVSTAPWHTLSIPKGQSQLYNADKFSQPKHDEHFTEEYLKRV